MSDTEDEIPSVLLPCSICSRTFRPEVLERHIKVCEKTASKKRKVFDSFKSRVSGTELEEFLGPAPLPGQSPKKPDKSPVKKTRGTPKWKETHENLIAVLRAARGVTVADPQTTLNKNAGNEQCPSCGRFFGPRAFDRHVQFCKEKTSRIKMTPSKVSQAQERLEARTKYKAPLSLKPKLTTKEKYSPMLPRKAEASDVCLISQGAKSPSFNSVPKNAKTKSTLSNFTRQSPTRSSERQRSVSPKKPLNSNSKVIKESYAKHLTPPKIKDSLKDTEDLRPRTGINTTTDREKIRSSNRKISDCEDDSPNSNQKHSYREKPRRKSCLSSDDGNETDTTNLSINSNTSHCEKILRREVKQNCFRSANAQNRISSPMESRKSRKLSPVINDLSVNDESFGIYVAPCSQQQKSKTNREKSEMIQMKDKKERIEEGFAKEGAREVAKLVLPNISTNRLSKIPKPKVFKNSEMKEEINQDVEINDESAELISRKDRERTAIIKKDNLQKPYDILDMNTKDMVYMANDFKIVSTLKAFEIRNDMEMEKSEAKGFSQSSLWETAVEELFKSDDPIDNKANISDPPIVDDKEDEFIILHVAEPKKLIDNDEIHTKISISEPCFKTDYNNKYSILDMIKKNSNVFVFNAESQFIKKGNLSQKRNKIRKMKEIKIVPRLSNIREKTFLANDNPKIKRRKLSGKQDGQLTKITNTNNYFFGYLTKVSEEFLRFRKISADTFGEEKEEPLRKLKQNFGKNKIIERNDKKSRKTKERDTTEKSENCHNSRMEKRVKSNDERSKTYQYFEISNDLDQEESLSESKSCLKSREEEKREIKNVKNVKMREINFKPRGDESDERESISESKSTFQFSQKYRETEKEELTGRKEMCNEWKKSGRNRKKGKRLRMEGIKSASKKTSICYSDEEFEELRQKKEKCFSHLKPKDPQWHKNFVSDAEGKYLNGEKISTVNSLANINHLGNITEEEDHGEKIQMEKFIVKKPNKTTILSKSNNCLEKFFPKLHTAGELKTSESSTAVTLGYEVNSTYDLKDEENLYGKMLKKRADKGIRLPEIGFVNANINRKGNSMSSLLQTWKVHKEIVESRMNFDVKPMQTKQSDLYQIALLPYVLTEKLVEVAGQFNNKKANDEGYDPFKQAERQMLALLSWPSIADLKSTNENSKSPSYSPNCINLETSPTSAFSRYPIKDEQMPKDAKESANQKVLNSSGRLGQSGNKSRDKEYTPTYAAADDWEEIFEKHFDVNRNEMNDKMTRSVKSALDGLLAAPPKKLSSSSFENSNSPRKNMSDLSENSVVDEIVYTSTPKRSPSRLSNGPDTSFDVSSQKTPNCHRKRSISHGRLTPPDDFSDSINKNDRGRKSNRNSGVSLSSLSFCSQASDTTLADDEIMKANLEIIGVGKGSPRGSKRRFARSQSVFDERNKMLFSKTFEHNFSSSDENEILPVINGKQGKTSMLNSPFPKSIPSRFPRSHSAMDDRCRGDGNFCEGRDQASSPEGSKSRKGKMSGDSAYSSLNRRSPRPGSQANVQEDRLSSSGSEHSLPPLSNVALKPRSLNFDNISSTKDQPYKMSKFCHECGSKYPVPVAKFCCECGVRRLII